MPLVINSLGHGHTLTRTHTDNLHRINFKKPGTHRPVASAGLTIKYSRLQHFYTRPMVINFTAEWCKGTMKHAPDALTHNPVEKRASNSRCCQNRIRIAN